jgi:hypothetical protein
VLGNLQRHYTGFDWGRMDGYADSLEGAINLHNREPIPSAAAWIDSEIRTMWSFQKDDGVIEGWHGDGNFARTSLMYALWKTQGLHIDPWRADVRLGAVRDDDRLLISLSADQPWSANCFRSAAARDYLRCRSLPPRISQFSSGYRRCVKDLHIRLASENQFRILETSFDWNQPTVQPNHGCADRALSWPIHGISKTFPVRRVMHCHRLFLPPAGRTASHAAASDPGPTVSRVSMRALLRTMRKKILDARRPRRHRQE